MAAKPKRPKIKFKVAQYDSADYLKSEADIKNDLAAVFEEPMDREMLIHTLGVVARARGMMKLAKETGITRTGLDKALSPKSNPSFETVAKIDGAFGMRMGPKTASTGSPGSRAGHSACRSRWFPWLIANDNGSSRSRDSMSARPADTCRFADTPFSTRIVSQRVV